MTSAGIMFQWEAIQAYCHRIGLPGLEEVFADGLVARGHIVNWGKEDGKQN